FYLKCIDAVLVVLNVAALFFLFHRIRAAARAIFPALIGCATVLVSVPGFLSLHHVSPEPLQLFGSLVLAGILAPVAFGSAWAGRARDYAVAIGCVLGFS